MDANTDRLLLGSSWVSNLIGALVMFLTISLTLFSLWEYHMLISTPGDAGYPIGSEASGARYISKEAYLEDTLHLIAGGGGLSLLMVLGLLTKRLLFTWLACLVALVSLVLLWATAGQ